MAIIDMFESCELTDNVIKYDDALKSAFVKMWNKVLPNEATFHSEAYLPFWFMQSEGFWHIVPLRGKEDILTVLKDSHVKPSESKLRDCVNYAELDEDLYFLMTLQSGRSSLKRALLETYTTLSTRMIDRLSESSDNFTDSSEEALNEYESIISFSEVNQSSTERKIDNELEERFSKLKEDIQYVLNIEYFTFLKKNINEREMFKEICPTVYDLYDRIAFNPIKQGEISPSISFTYENFLADLKITLMSEDGSFELIDKINEAISCLSSLESEQPEYSFDDNVYLGVVMASTNYPESSTKGVLIENINAKAPEIFHMGTAKKDGKYYTNGGRVLFVSGKGKDIKEAYDNAYKRVCEIKSEALFYRHDIGFKAMKGE